MSNDIDSCFLINQRPYKNWQKDTRIYKNRVYRTNWNVYIKVQRKD